MKNNFPINAILDHLKKQNTFVFLENGLTAGGNRFSYIFTQPLEIISCFKPEEMRMALGKIRRRQKNGYYLAGFISYEAGYAFEPVFRPKKQYAFPLVWMGVFKKPDIFDHRKNKFITVGAKNLSKADTEESRTIPPSQQKYKLLNRHLNTGARKYRENIKRIKRLIEKGDTYQVNYALKYKFDFQGDAFAFYRDLRNNQPTSYTAFIQSRPWRIISFSPELFFRQNKQNICVRPMKGTAKRGTTAKEDTAIKNHLQNDPKNRAENLMIVDLLRNDLGKIACVNSVKTADLFAVEKHPTLFQMTSTVKSKLRKNIHPGEMFSSLFPSGSVTGAPKIRTMQIIKALEKEERKIYTGAIGFISPKSTAVFNVAIRTLLLEDNETPQASTRDFPERNTERLLSIRSLKAAALKPRMCKGEMGIGSGITYDSNADGEYDECLLKADFLIIPPFKLIETMRWSKKEGFFLFGLHMRRLESSSKFFNFCFPKAQILRELKKTGRALSQKHIYKIRLLLAKNGTVSLEPSVLEQNAVSFIPKITVSDIKTNPQDTFLYHKTTNRTLYDKEYKYYSKRGFYDVLFFNKKNELTEGAISNIFIKKKGVFYTPPVACGLLTGVFREYLLRTRPEKVKEKIITKEELKNAEEIYLANSVRGMVRVRLENECVSLVSASKYCGAPRSPAPKHHSFKYPLKPISLEPHGSYCYNPP